jgi:cobalamin biosynthesis protein CobD/CbiB
MEWDMMSDEVWKALIESVSEVISLAIVAGFFAYMFHEVGKDGNLK